MKLHHLCIKSDEHTYTHISSDVWLGSSLQQHLNALFFFKCGCMHEFFISLLYLSGVFLSLRLSPPVSMSFSQSCALSSVTHSYL